MRTADLCYQSRLAVTLKRIDLFSMVVLFVLGLFTLHFMRMSICLHVCVCTTYMSGALGGWKSGWDPLELELLMAVNPHGSHAGNQTLVLYRRNKYSSPFSHPSLQPLHSVF